MTIDLKLFQKVQDQRTIFQKFTNKIKTAKVLTICLANNKVRNRSEGKHEKIFCSAHKNKYVSILTEGSYKIFVTVFSFTSADL